MFVYVFFFGYFNMSHCKSKKYFNRSVSHRKAMFINMTVSMIKYDLIRTTYAKAKHLRKVCEPIITLSKIDNLHNRRLVFSRLKNKVILNKLFELGKKFKNRPGGYLRIIKCGFRNGDSTQMAVLKFVDNII